MAKSEFTVTQPWRTDPSSPARWLLSHIRRNWWIVLIIFVFQFLVIRRRMPNPRRVLAGFAFVLVGLAFALAYPRKRLAGALLAPVAIGALELLQMWAPGRHARLSDFVVDLLATWAGLAIAVARDWLLQRYRKVPT